MSTSIIRKAMQAAGHIIKPSWLTLVMYHRALRHTSTCMEQVSETDNCLRALAIDTSTNMWAAKHLLPAISYTQLVLHSVPSSVSNLSYTEVRNTLRQLRYALSILEYTERSLLAMRKARLQVYIAALSWKKPLDHTLYAELTSHSHSVLKQLSQLTSTLNQITHTYHRKLKELKHEARNSK